MEAVDASAATGPSAGRAVLDTNAWLDVYVFDDERARPLARALQLGRLQALRSVPTDGELEAVLQREAIVARCDPVRRDALLAQWRALAQPVDAQRFVPAPWVCRDLEDQKFLDLACAGGATWLFSKDRALLELARPAARQGLHILVPGAFALAAIDLPPRRGGAAPA